MCVAQTAKQRFTEAADATSRVPWLRPRTSVGLATRSFRRGMSSRFDATGLPMSGGVDLGDLGGGEWLAGREVGGLLPAEPSPDPRESDGHDNDASGKGNGCDKWVVAPSIGVPDFAPSQHLPGDRAEGHTAPPHDGRHPRGEVAAPE